MSDMTSATAIDLLDNLIGMIEDNQENDYDTALRMAIEALKAQAYGDTISRQALCEYALNQKDKSVTPNDIMRFPSAQPERRWIPCSERMPEEDHWLGGSGRQFSDEVLVSVANYDDEDIWTYISQTIDGEWALELPRHCKITAWRNLPEPYKEGEE